MYNRVFQNWKTSSLGMGLMLISLVLVWLGMASLSDCGTFIGGAMVLFFSKDEITANKV
jgi:hypothetical protein